MSASLTCHGLMVPVALMRQRLRGRYNDVLDKLTICYQPAIGAEVRTALWRLVRYNGVECLALPRTLIAFVLRTKIVERVDVSLGAIQYATYACDVVLLPNQKIIVDHLLREVFTADRIALGTACCILNARAGSGKTFIAAALIQALQMRTLYIVPKKPLALQIAKDIGQDIDCIVINSALTRPREFFAQYSFIILDEVHMYCSPKRADIFRKIGGHCVLGMSATTDERCDGCDVVAHRALAFDGVIYAAKLAGWSSTEMRIAAEVQVIRYNGPAEYTRTEPHPSTGKVFVPWICKLLLRDPARNALVVAEIARLYHWRGNNGERHNIYVFCEQREALQTLIGRLQESFDISAPELTNFVGGSGQTVKPKSRIVCTTYAYCAEGVSFVQMTAIVFLTPRKSNMIQILARILRAGSDANITRQIVDIVDNKTPLRGQYAKRREAYDYYGMRVIARSYDAPC